MIFTCKNTDKLYRGKSSKKLFPERYNYEKIVSPQSKKLFPLLTNQETNDKPKKVIERPTVRIDVIKQLFLEKIWKTNKPIHP